MGLRSSDIAAASVTVVFGALTGWLMGGFVLAVVGAAIGGLFGVVAGRANVRPAITMTVFVGAMAGALIGSSVVETICLPDSCVAIEATAAVVLGLGALVGVGLVAALVMRSFDEYNESVDRGAEAPGPGCEAEDPDPGTEADGGGSSPSASGGG
jgi:hypothetical protein